MKTFPLHPASFAAGLAIAAAFVFLTSQTSVTTFPTARVEVGPHPRDMVQIREGQPFTVPPGKILVVTAVGSLGQNATSASLQVNGVQEVGVSVAASPSRVVQLPTCFSVHWGSVVDVTGSFATGRAWGYLAER